ncbi:MAG: polysaccharide deacetylase family protein [Bdellovibrionales bacterium]
MSAQVTFTLDLEDHRPDNRLPIRYPEITDRILGFLEERGIKATIFTVGKLAESNPELIKRIHHLGHEVAHHSYDHTPIDKQSAQVFRETTKKAKNIIEDIIGAPVSGYRAPIFSLTKQTSWAIDILKELGFSYSSSTLPIANPLYGFPGIPTSPFKWKNGLIEIPAPIAKVGPLSLPYLGGFYFRYTPFALIKKQAGKADGNDVLWTYCHPYDFDPEEKNWRINGASIPVSLLLWFNRGNTFDKLEKLSESFSFSEPFKDLKFSEKLQVIDPSTL